MGKTVVFLRHNLKQKINDFITVYIGFVFAYISERDRERELGSKDFLVTSKYFFGVEKIL